MILKQIIDSYDFDPRFLSYFASQCAKEAMTKVKDPDPDPRSMLAIEVAERYGNGEDFDQGYLDKVRDDAAAAAARYASLYAYDAAYDAADHASAADHAYYAAYYAALALGKDNQDYFVPLLLRLIETRLTKLEQCLILGTTNDG